MDLLSFRTSVFMECFCWSSGLVGLHSNLQINALESQDL